MPREADYFIVMHYHLAEEVSGAAELPDDTTFFACFNVELADKKVTPIIFLTPEDSFIEIKHGCRESIRNRNSLEFLNCERAEPLKSLYYRRVHLNVVRQF